MNHLNDYGYIALICVLLFFCIIAVVAFSHYFVKYFLLKLIHKAFGKRNGLGKIMYKNYVFHRIAYLIPALIIYHFAYLFNFTSKYATIYLADLVYAVTTIYIFIGTALVFTALLDCLNDKYRHLAISKQKPIKSYLQVLKLIIFIVTGIFTASLLFDKSPTYFLTGVGAATAILVLVFKDSIMGFVASIQLAAYDMVRIGDWIEMPSFGADGEVIDISLNTVKVQNFDKTFVTIPSYALLTTGIKNWRGMQEAGGRRVKQAFYIDITSIKRCDKKLLDQLGEMGISIAKHDLTNVGALRNYLETYLKKHPGVHKGMRSLIRQQQGTSTGLPLELSFFTNETDSAKHEAIQADVFDHIYAVLVDFDLRAFQLGGK